MTAIRAQQLRNKHRNFLKERKTAFFRDTEEQNRSRIARALSWLEASERVVAQMEGGKIGREEGMSQSFMFLWISFNAAYGYDPNVPESETTQLKKRTTKQNIDRFIRRIKRIDSDAENLLKEIVDAHVSVFDNVLKNPFMYEYFWSWVRARHRNESNSYSGNWRSSQRCGKFEEKNRTPRGSDRFLFVVFDRLRTLRNQIFHGGASYVTESLGKSSIEAGQQVLAILVPAILKIMLDAPRDKNWGVITYPRIRGDSPGSSERNWFDSDLY